MTSFSVAANGSSVETASGPSQLLSMDKPLTKLDTTNPNSFQTIQLLFNREPTQPPSSSPFYARTLVYQFKHGYTYIPAIWFSWQNPSPAFPANPGVGGTATTFYPNGDDTAGENAYQQISLITGGNGVSPLATEVFNSLGTIVETTNALLYVNVGTTYVSLYVIKETLALVGGSAKPIFLIGLTLNIRFYVFTEPAITSTY